MSTPIRLIRGDDYHASDEREITFEAEPDIWPDIAGADVDLIVETVAHAADIATIAATVVDADTVTVNIDGATIAELESRGVYRLVATLVSDRVVTLARGSIRLR